MRVFRPFFVFQIPKIESWLAEQAKRGSKLVSYKHGSFTFMTCTPEERRYLIWPPPFYIARRDKALEKLDKFSDIKDNYSLNKSSLNKAYKQGDTTIRIVEIDVKKIDTEFEELCESRARYFTKEAKRSLFAELLALLVWAALIIPALPKIPSNRIFIFIIPLFFIIPSVISSVLTLKNFKLKR